MSAHGRSTAEASAFVLNGAAMADETLARVAVAMFQLMRRSGFGDGARGNARLARNPPTAQTASITLAISVP